MSEAQVPALDECPKVPSKGIEAAMEALEPLLSGVERTLPLISAEATAVPCKHAALAARWEAIAEVLRLMCWHVRQSIANIERLTRKN